MNQILRSLVGGFLMGMADLVPGVSGGTVALVIGIYTRLVSSVRQGSSALGSLLRLDFESFKEHLRRVDWLLIIPLAIGILTAIVLLASFIEHQIEERPTIVAGLFLGLVLGSIVIASRLLENPDRRHLAIAVAVGVVLFLVLGFGESDAESNPPLLAFLGAGSLAICAMILPGISGSLILLMIGMYKPVLNAVTDRDLASIAVFGIGAIIGLAVFSQILHRALSRYHDLVLAALIGLMIGSTRVLWPWPSGVEGPELGAPEDDWFVVLLSIAVGIFVVFAVSRLSLPEKQHVLEQHEVKI